MNQGFLQKAGLHTQPYLIAIVFGIPHNDSTNWGTNIWIHLRSHISVVHKISDLNNAPHCVVTNVDEDPKRCMILNFAMNQLQIKWSIFANQDRVGSPKILVGFSVVVDDLLPEVLISDI